MKKLLVIEDEENVAAVICKGLQENEYDVKVSHSGHEALQLMQNHQFDMVILDIMMPGMSGIEVCKKIRLTRHQHTPVLMLTALGTTEDVVKGLDAGADDYLVKPFKFKELLARVRAHLRRTLPLSNDGLLIAGDLELDINSRMVKRNGIEINLTSTEYKLLEYFMKNQGKIIDRSELLLNVWDINFQLGTNVVDVYVNYLRNKIDKDFPVKLIRTVVGMGYILDQSAYHENQK